MPYSPRRAQPLGFAPLQPFGAYPWQPYVQPGDGHQPTLVIHRVAAPSTTLRRGNLLLLNQLFPSHPIYMAGHKALGVWKSPIPSTFPCMVGRGLLLQVLFHPMTWLTLNLLWALNLVILVWRLSIRLMSLLTP